MQNECECAKLNTLRTRGKYGAVRAQEMEKMRAATHAHTTPLRVQSGAAGCCVNTFPIIGDDGLNEYIKSRCALLWKLAGSSRCAVCANSHAPLIGVGASSPPLHWCPHAKPLLPLLPLLLPLLLPRHHQTNTILRRIAYIHSTI